MPLRLHLNRTNYFDKQPKNYLGELVFDEWKAQHGDKLLTGTTKGKETQMMTKEIEAIETEKEKEKEEKVQSSNAAGGEEIENDAKGKKNN
jgi:hypothetical protein